MYTYGGIEEGLLHSRRLCEYYSVEFDVWILLKSEIW
jgi:hypothetical protein